MTSFRSSSFLNPTKAIFPPGKNFLGFSKYASKLSSFHIIPEDNKREIVEFDKDILKAVKVISVSEATAILKYTLTKPVIPLNLNESDISRSQKSDFESENLKENLTH